MHMKSSLTLLISGLLFFQGCGKHETESGVIGAVTGGAIGNLVSSGHNKGAGTFLGAAIGGLIGSGLGKETDQEVAYQKEKLAHAKRELNRERNKPKIVVVAPSQARNYCSTCSRTIGIAGALRCPACGDILVSEKVCKLCHAAFEPKTNCSYCPYCPDRSRLVWR